MPTHMYKYKKAVVVRYRYDDGPKRRLVTLALGGETGAVVITPESCDAVVPAPPSRFLLLDSAPSDNPVAALEPAPAC